MTNPLDIEAGAIAQLYGGVDLYLLKPNMGMVEFPMEGTNTNGVAVAYHSPTEMEPEDKDQLYKIISAGLKLDPTAVALINLAQVPAPAFANIVSQTGCKYLLVFGATPADMSMLVAAKRYIVLSMQGVKVIFSDSIEVLRNDGQRKRYLWDCLQLMFGLK
jgi:hypothetical protein